MNHVPSTCDHIATPPFLRMLYKQEVLNNTTMEGNRSKVKVQQYMREQGDYFRKRRERENMRMRTALLQRQIQQQERLEKEGECA